MVDRQCDECGDVYAAKRQTSKFCSTACRVRANRRPSKIGMARADAEVAASKKPAAKKTTARKTASKKAPAKKAAAKKTAPAKETPAPPPAPVYDSLADQLEASLTALQALDTISGMAALRIAQQIDRGRDSGSAVATLSKELSRLVTEAKIEAAPRIRDAADEIAQRAGEKMLRLVQ